jgi:PAS domain S-box-containing protein
MKYLYLFMLFFFVLGISPARSNILISKDSRGEIPVQKSLYLLEDPLNQLSIKDIVSFPANREFILNSDKKTGYGYSNSTFWLRLTIAKDVENPLQWVLKHTYPHLDRLEFYAPDKESGYTMIRTGDGVPFNLRPVKNRLFVFPIDPAPGGTTYYLRLSSKGAINFPVTVVDTDSFQNRDRDIQLGAGLFFGALLIMVAYNLLFFVFVRERLYFYYALHVFFLALHQIVWFGFGYEYVWPSFPWLNNLLDMLAGSGLFFFLGLFTIDFLHTKQQMPRLHYPLKWLTFLVGLVGVASFFVEREIMLRPNNNIQIVLILTLFIVGVAGAIKKIRQAYIFLVAWTIALGGALFLIGYRNNLLPEIPILSHSIQVGILLNVLLISMGLADRINQMKNSLARVNRDFSDQNKELKIAFKSAEASEKRFRELSELLPQTAFELDLQGNVTYTNQHGLKITGYTMDDVRQGFNVIQLFEAHDHARLKKGIKEILTQKNIHQAEYLLKRKDGTLVPVFLYNNAITSGGKPVGFRGVLLDLTERKKTEELMIQTEKMMSLGGLAAGMAHEINNPLAGIIQSTQVIQNRLTRVMPANEKALEELDTTMAVITGFMEKRGILVLLDNIDKSGNRAAKIIDNMLSFSRKSDAVKKPHRLEDILESALALARNDYDLKKHYDFKNIEIQRAFTQGLPLVLCESSKIQQVVFNILKNAFQAMNDWEDMGETPVISLGLFPADNMVRIEIQDNGPGMDHKTRKKVFEPFFTTKRLGSGTGLGLSVSYFIIVDDHSGKMEVKTTPEKGATFIIYLPTEANSLQPG